MTWLLGLMAAAFAVGAMSAAGWPWRAGARVVSLGAALVGCVAAIGLAAAILVMGGDRRWSLPHALAPTSAATLRLDPLGAWFLLLIGFTGLSASLYACGDSRHFDGTTEGRVVHASFNAFLAAMCLVVMADHVVLFLGGWELMALFSYVLVVTGPTHDQTAGLWYAVMTHLGFLALVAAFFTLAQHGPLGFSDLRAAATALSPAASRTMFWLGLVAFGSKAGVVPLHVWLPRAHPAAPSHVSAVMSAAMVSLGVYGCVRLFFDLVPVGPAWWGGVLLAIGIVTALTGVLYTVAESHFKRVLAYSTIEHVGLVFVSLGFALLMRGYGFPALAALGLIVALLHVLNHALFKSLLFLGAGAVVHATHASSLEDYGGLIARMPSTAILCLVGVLALAALPPLNGFPSEWLLFQLLVAGTRHTAPELAIVLPLAVASVALVAGLAAVSAVRIFGITFLALPRTPGAVAAVDAGRSVRFAMTLPAVACVVLGFAPAVALSALRVVARALGLPAAELAPHAVLRLPINGSQLAPGALAATCGALTLAFTWLTRRRSARTRVHVGPAWNCGRIGHSPRAEYTAAAFAEPLKRVFAGFYQPRQEVTVQVHPASPYFVRSIQYRSELAPWMEQAFYAPVIHATRWASLHVRRLQTGSVHFYLALLPMALVGLLLFARWIR